MMLGERLRWSFRIIYANTDSLIFLSKIVCATPLQGNFVFMAKHMAKKRIQTYLFIAN